MAKDKMKGNISVTIKRTFNLGNFENVSPMYTITEEVDDCQLTDQEIQKRTEELRGVVMEEIMSFKKAYIPNAAK